MDAKGVERIANLANIELDPEAVEGYAKSMTNILKMADEMQSVNTMDVIPLAHPLELQQPLRADVVTEVDEHQLFQSTAPDVADDLYLVPIVIEPQE